MGICQSSSNLTNFNNYPLFSFNGLITKAYICDIYDGDTVTCIFKFNNQYNKFKIRMYGYYAPEMKPSKSIEEK
jgi:endonuclease YncB( thermonuclease family)